MQDNERAILIFDTEGNQLYDFPSIKKANVFLYGGTGLGRSLLYSMCVGRMKKANCPKLDKQIIAKYKN